MVWPSTLSTFVNPVPTDRLSTTPHSSIETAQNTGIKELQAFIGTESSIVGTLLYDIRGAGSNGGGHVQTANKGGTGQTAYTKGNILVATSSSVLTKLAVGNDAQVLTANSSVAAGVQWSTPGTAFSNKIAISTTQQTFGSSVAANLQTSIFSVAIPGSTLGVSNGVKATVFVNSLSANLAQAGSVVLAFKYGANTVSSVAMGGTSGSNPGKLEYFLLADNSSVLQRGNAYTQIGMRFNSQGVAWSSVISAYQTGTSSINSSGNQNFEVSVRFQDNSPSNALAIDGYVIEKIA